MVGVWVPATPWKLPWSPVGGTAHRCKATAPARVRPSPGRNQLMGGKVQPRRGSELHEPPDPLCSTPLGQCSIQLVPEKMHEPPRHEKQLSWNFNFSASRRSDGTCRASSGADARMWIRLG